MCHLQACTRNPTNQCGLYVVQCELRVREQLRSAGALKGEGARGLT